MRATRVRESPQIVLNTKHSTKDIGIGKTFIHALAAFARTIQPYSQHDLEWTDNT